MATARNNKGAKERKEKEWNRKDGAVEERKEKLLFALLLRNVHQICLRMEKFLFNSSFPLTVMCGFKCYGTVVKFMPVTRP